MAFGSVKVDAIITATQTVNIDEVVLKTGTQTLTNKTLTAPTLTAPVLGTPASGILTNCTFPTLNQNTTGNAAGLSATLAVASGGTGVTSSTGTGSVVLSASPTFTGTVTIPTGASIIAPTGLVKGDVGLGSVDNTADTAKPVSTAQQTALDLKAPLASPTFTGTPTLPTGTIATTQTAADNSTKLATTAYVETAVTNLVDSAPATLNTLNELALALGDDPNFATTVSTNIGLKANLASPTFTGTVILPSGTVTSAMILDETIVNADISASASIADTKLATISTASKVSNSATTATNANTASAIVARDGSGNFTAGTITAALTGTASGNLVSGGALGTPSSGTLTNCTFPTLNQNTTGSSASCTGNATTATTANAVNTANTYQVSALGIGQAAGTGTELDLAGRYAQTSIAVAALDIDCSLGNYYTKTISSSSTFTFSNIPASRSYAFTLCVTHDSGTITWPGSVKWPKNTAPTLNTYKNHKFMFSTYNGGSVFYGAALVDFTY